MKQIASNEEWTKWGEIDPLFGVASWKGKRRDGPAPWTNEQFYKLGESDWSDFIRHWERYGVAKESCLEIGCGVGRITMQLAGYFGRVHALDVSEKMIEYAKQHIGNPHVTFHLSNGIDIPLDTRSVASVFSTHVFQHFDSLSFANRYFADISRVLRPGGTLMIHLPLYRWPSMKKSFNRIYMVHRTVQHMRASAKRRLMRYGLVKPIMRVLSYPMDFFYDVLPKYNFDDIELCTFATRSNNDPHPFVFARKKASTG